MAALLTLFRHATREPLPVTDSELLHRFSVGRDEPAFAELVRRHGPVVYRICRRLVGSRAADDAFQATFLVLATRIDAAQAAGSVGGWLIGVAGRVARQMRRTAARRTHHETAAAATRPADDADHPVDLADQFRVLDEELARLSDRLRDPVVLCLLQGRTQEEAARELGRDARTLRRRLERAKRVLRARLERRGVVPAIAAALITAAGSVSASVPHDLANRTVSTVFDFLTGGASRLEPVILAKGVASNMFARKLTHLMALAAVGLIGVGVVLADDTPAVPAPPATKATPVNVQSLSTPTAPVRAEFRHASETERTILIQALHIQAPEGFCERNGLTDEPKQAGLGFPPEALALSRREARMLNALIRADKEKGEIVVLSRPQLICLDNQSGFIHVGQDVPVPTNVVTENKNGKVVTQTTMETRKVGSMLRVTPRALPDGKSILLRVESQHTSVVPQLIQLGHGLTAPAFNIQTMTHTVSVPVGGTAMSYAGTLRSADDKKFELFWILTPQMLKAPPDVQPPAKQPAAVAPPVAVPVWVPPQFSDFPYLNRLFPAAETVPPPGVILPETPVIGPNSPVVPAPKPAPRP